MGVHRRIDCGRGSLIYMISESTTQLFPFFLSPLMSSFFPLSHSLSFPLSPSFSFSITKFRVLSELTASTIAASASKDKPKDKSKNKSLSVLLVDVGSPHGPRNKDSERRFHPQGEHSENASGSQTLDSRTVNACGFQNSHSRPDECIGGAGDVGSGATVENDESIGNIESVRNVGNEEVECVRWGVGDRVGLFLFIQGVKGEVQKTELEPIVESESGGGVIQGGGIGSNNSNHDIDRKGGRVVDCEDKNSDTTTHTHPPSPSRSASQLRSSCPAHTDIRQVSGTPVHEESRFNLNSNTADRNTSAKLLMHAKVRGLIFRISLSALLFLVLFPLLTILRYVRLSY